MTCTIGKQRHRLVLHLRLTEEKPGGNHVNVYRPIGTIFGQIMPLKSREILIAMGQQIEITHRIRVRYDPRIKPYMRLMYGTRPFDVTSVVNEDEEDRFQLLYCREKLEEVAL